MLVDSLSASSPPFFNRSFSCTMEERMRACGAAHSVRRYQRMPQWKLSGSDGWLRLGHAPTIACAFRRRIVVRVHLNSRHNRRELITLTGTACKTSWSRQVLLPMGQALTMQISAHIWSIELSTQNVPIHLQKADQTRHFSQWSLVQGHTLSNLVSGCMAVDETILSAPPPPDRPAVTLYRTPTFVPTSSFENIIDTPKAVYHPSSFGYSVSEKLPAKVFLTYVPRR